MPMQLTLDFVYLEPADSTAERRLSIRLEFGQKIIRLGLPDDFSERMELEESD